MRTPRRAFRTVFGTALAGALFTFNVARPAERLSVPSLLSSPPVESQSSLLLGPIDDQLTPLPKLPPVAPRSAAAQPEPPKLGDEGEIWLVQQPKELPKAPTPAAPVEQTPTTAPATAPAAPSVSGSLGGDILGTAGGGAGTGGAVNPASTSGGALSASQQAAPATSANVVGGGEAASRATTDVGDLLGKSINALGVEVHHLSPIISDPVIRGYHIGQYVTQADGGFWFPARMDLDTIVSKIDSSQIENVTIIKGPYSVRYGPGFSFLDVETLATPRYEGGWQTHESSGLTYKSNGQQWLGIQSVYGGNDTMGFRCTYIVGAGTDYWDGDGVRQPSGYNTQSFNFDVGWTLGRYSRIEAKAMHLEQHDVKIPGAFMDIEFLSSDAYTLRYFYDDKDRGKFGIDTWFNYTRLAGNNFLPSKRQQFPEIDNILGTPAGLQEADFATTQARMASWGYRAYATSGTADSLQVTLGTDLHYLNGALNEFDAFTFPNPATPLRATNFPVPPAYMQDPGVFLDSSVNMNRLTIKGGVRFDWVRTAVSNLFPPAPDIPGFPGGVVFGGPTGAGAYSPEFPNTAFTGSELAHQYTLWSAFITPEWKVNDHITVLGGIGYAQRPPTFTELYAIQPFLGVIQNGLNFVTGNPLLAPETCRQVDLGMKLNYDQFRAGVNGYYSWIHNYITFSQNIGNFATSPTGTPLDFGYQYINTHEATLAGGEMYLEWDARKWLTVFGTLAYVYGRDRSVDGRAFFNPATGTLVPGSVAEPLPNIPPLDARVGIRLHDPCEARRYGLELTARIDTAQNQVATDLLEQDTPGFTVWDVRSYYQVSKNLLFTAGIENLFNKQYREWADLRPSAGYTVFQPGFNAYVSIRLTY